MFVSLAYRDDNVHSAIRAIDRAFLSDLSNKSCLVQYLSAIGSAYNTTYTHELNLDSDLFHLT